MARLFLSTDDNAPVIAGNDRTCLVNLLKKCLVEGYGSKAPVGGWTMPYSTADGRVGVFRNDYENGGLGHYLRLGQDDDATNRMHIWNVSAFENMTDENAGVFPYMNAADTIQSSDTPSSIIRPWILLASKTWMMLVVYYQAVAFDQIVATQRGYATSGFWFGDIDPWNPSDNYHSMFAVIASYNAVFGSTIGASNISSSGNAYRFPRKSDGVGGEPVSHHCFLPHPQSGARFGAQGPAYSAASGLLVARAALNDAQPHTLRGWIPDMLVPLHIRPFEHLERVELNGRNHVAVNFSSGYYSASENCSQALFELDAGE